MLLVHAGAHSGRSDMLVLLHPDRMHKEASPRGALAETAVPWSRHR